MSLTHFQEGRVSFDDMCALLQEVAAFGSDLLTLRVVAIRDQNDRWIPFVSILKNDSNSPDTQPVTQIGPVALISVCHQVRDIKKSSDLHAFLVSWEKLLDGQSVVPGYADQIQLDRVGGYSIFGRYPCWQGPLQEVYADRPIIMTPRGPFLSPESGIIKDTIGGLAAAWTGMPGYGGEVQPRQQMHSVIRDTRAHFSSGRHSGLQIEIGITAIPTLQDELRCAVSAKDFNGVSHSFFAPVKEGSAIFTLPTSCQEIEVFLLNSEGYWFDRLIESKYFCDAPFSLLGLFHRGRDAESADLLQALARGEGEAVTENTADHDYDIIELLARFKDGIIEAVTKNTGWFEDDEYRNTRKLIMGYPGLRDLAPGWLHIATTLQSVIIEVRRLAGRESGSWDRAREIVADGLSPMIDALLTSEIAANRNLERLDRLGGGGFGEVYRYRNNLIGVEFAVKVLDPAFAGEGDRSFHRFLREARMLFQMNHPNIVRVHDIALTLGDRRPYIRMELVEGDTLNARLATTGSLAPKDANHIALQIAHALAHAHGIGIVHRDVKPSNIMLSPNGRVVLLDFGLGVFVEEDIGSRITKTGEAVVVGRYTAPDLEANPKLLDPKTDVFSLGAVWFTMLCGQPPASVGVEAALRAVPSISNGVVELVLRCLSPLAVERPTADDLIHELEKLRPAPPPARAVRHIEEEPEEEIESDWVAVWKDTV